MSEPQKAIPPQLWVGGAVVLVGFLVLVGFGSSTLGALAGFAVTAVGVLLLARGLSEQARRSRG